MFFGIQGMVLAWIRTLFCSRTQAVIFSGHLSEHVNSDVGSSPGQCPWGMLCVLYIVDFIELAKHHSINVHSFADDTQLYVHTPVSQIAHQLGKLTTCITDVKAWMSLNCLKLTLRRCNSQSRDMTTAGKDDYKCSFTEEWSDCHIRKRNLSWDRQWLWTDLCYWHPDHCAVFTNSNSFVSSVICWMRKLPRP